MSQIKYVLGLDIGIGSVGWAVVRCEGDPRIENFGVRIFESGENEKRKSRKSQERRDFRAGRRLVRRRAHRKERIRFWFQKQGLATEKEIKAFFNDNKDMISLRVRALDEKISPAGLAACMIHISNHRGYREFYDYSAETEADSEEAQDAEGVQKMRDLYRRGNYRSVAEMISKEQCFSAAGIPFRRYRNRAGREERFIMPREEIKAEARSILLSQQRFYPAITDDFIEKILGILFAQRDFEDGPGNPEDGARPYKGFDGSEGNCPFYPDEKRGHRFNCLADEYALVNALSQFRWFDEKTGEASLPPALAQELLGYALQRAGLSVKEVKDIAKKHGIAVVNAEGEKKNKFTKTMKYLPAVKPLFERAGFDWNALVSEDASDMQGCLLNEVGEVLSLCVTPGRRSKRLKKLARIAGCEELIGSLTRLRLSGTAKVSYKYMRGAVSAFLEGELYGNYQASVIKQAEATRRAEADRAQRQYKLAPFGKDFEFYKNPVVMRSINETRKAINRAVEEYGSPYAINIEVGSDLSLSFDARAEVSREQAKNEKARDAAKKKIAELLGCPESEVSPAMCERYFLYEQQDGKCLYSGKPIDQAAAIRNSGKQFEVDHIVPFSLVLDDTLHNKALVYHGENQAKGQRVPLEYLSGERKENFMARVNLLSREKKISQKKYKYLTAVSADDTDAIKEWKSRNINDTRYISRFLVNYLKDHLLFRGRDPGDEYRPDVYAVKGAVTSQMRRAWLNEKTWGRRDKSQLKEQTYLDHAADAIVVACCLPVYVEMTAVHRRLRRILKGNNGMPDAEYEGVLANAKQALHRYYGFPLTKADYYLTRCDARPSLIRDLRTEADIRLQDPDIFNFFEKEKAEREGRNFSPASPESVADKFRKEVLSFYKNDPAFARSLQMPFTVHIPSRKASGKITDENAVRIVRSEEGDFRLSRKLVQDLTKKDLEKLYTRDEDLRRSLSALFEGQKEGKTVRDLLEGKEFRTQKGAPVRRVTLRADAKRTLRKQISENNYSLLTDTSYYCVEVYRDEEGKTRTAGIAFSDIVIQDGRVRLKPAYVRPEGYKEHCLYLFTNDYIRVTKKTKQGEEIKFEGYYRSVASINASKFYSINYNNPLQKNITFYITPKDTVEKFDIDPIGRIGGKIRCGEQLSSARENG